MPAHAEVTLIEKGKLQKIVDPAAAVWMLLSEPINLTPLAELARGRKSACILICDILRGLCPIIFPVRPMIETMVASGIALERIIILRHTVFIGQTLAKSLLNWSAIHGSWSGPELRTMMRATTPIMSISASPVTVYADQT